MMRKTRGIMELIKKVQPLTAVTRNGEFCCKFKFASRKNFYL